MDKVSLPRHIFKNGYGSATLEKSEADGDYFISVRCAQGGDFRLLEREVAGLGELLREIQIFVAQEKQLP